MKRRTFITLLGGAAAAWPLAARAQQGRIPVIGVLRPNRQHVVETFAEPFRRYMKAIGWEEGLHSGKRRPCRDDGGGEIARFFASSQSERLRLQH
jgi:hypothetical protein